MNHGEGIFIIVFIVVIVSKTLMLSNDEIAFQHLLTHAQISFICSYFYNQQM